jgi:hypothetical protein
MVELPIATGFYEDANRPIASQECINFIPQMPQAAALSQAQLIGADGIASFAVAGSSSSRGVHTMAGIAYSVNGDRLYRINSDGTTTDLGAITGTGRVSMADNGLEICIVVPRVAGYIYSVASGLQIITDTNFTNTLGPSEQVVYKSGYFVHYNNVNNAESNPIVFHSNLRAGLVYNALDYGVPSIDPDLITGMHVNRNQLYIGGEVTFELFQDIGGAGFAFQTIPGAVMPIGVRAKFSLIDFSGGFVGVCGGENDQPAIWKFSGSSQQKISTAAIDNILQQSTDAEVENIYTTTYSAFGGFFVNFHFKNRCMTYDSATGLWHERKSKDLEGRPIAWRVNGIIDAYGVNLVTDSQDGRIGKLGRDVYEEYGIAVNRSVSTIPFQNQGERIRVSKIRLTCNSGVGLEEKKKSTFPLKFPYTFGDDDLIPGVDPNVVMSFSDDGGYTFSNGISRELGKEGEYRRQQVWRKGGQIANVRVYRFSFGDPVKCVVSKLEAAFA